MMMACVSTQDGDDLQVAGKVQFTMEENARAECPLRNGIQHRPTPPVGAMQTHYDRFSPTSENIQEDEEGEFEERRRSEDYEMSPEAQAHNISLFLSSASESGEELVSETVITDVYKDPLDVCMEGIEDMATGILRTGKLLISGEPGDMTKIQPALFNLQATEKSISPLLPQLLQNPFFYQFSPESMPIMNSDLDEPFLTEDEALAKGYIRLALPVDTAIYSLLRFHCAKGARQAEEVINVSLNENYIPSHNLATFPVLPPIIKFRSSKGSNSGSSVPCTVSTLSESSSYGGLPSSTGAIASSGGSSGSLLRVSSPYGEGKKSNLSSSSISTDERSTTSGKISSVSTFSNGTNITSSSSLLSDSFSTTEEQKSLAYQGSMGELCSSGSTLHEELEPEEGGEGTTGASIPASLMNSPTSRNSKRRHRPLSKTVSSSSKGRKTSVVQPPIRSDSTSSDTSVNEVSRYIPGADHWNTSIMDNNTIVAQYGDLSYPIVWWDPVFKIDFRLSTSVGLLSGNVTGIDMAKPEVTLKVFNNSPKQIGFAIRSNRQSAVFKSHVVYPKRGLEIVEPYKSWEDNVEFYPNSPDMMEMFVIDLFFCTLDTKPTWNIIRKYAIMKAQKTNKNGKRISKRKFSLLQAPPSIEQKEENLKLVISHGLQCVVKGKLSEAEIIFSHALYLPDFQRVPLKAFVYICLAVISNKWKKEGHGTLKSVMLASEASSKLVSVCEQGPGSVKMPRTLQLVKQLKKELNVQKIVKDQHRSKKIAPGTKGTPKLEEIMVEESVTPDGTVLAFKDTIVVIPPQAVKQDMQVTLSSSDTKHLTSMLRASGWEKIVQVVVAFHIETSASVSRFDVPVQIVTPLPSDVKLGPNSLIRLMHSNYLRHWVDITNDILSKVSISTSTSKLEIETNLPGWLAISIIEFDASMIAQMVLKYISIEPTMLRFSIYGFLDTERQSMQVAVFVVPCKPNEEPLYKDFDKPNKFVPISFSHVIQAYPNEKLRLEIQGSSFEPDTSLGEENLKFEMEVQQKHNEVYTKWIKFNSSNDQPLCGKMKISSCRGNADTWDIIAHMNLSTRTTCVSSSSSSSSEL